MFRREREKTTQPHASRSYVTESTQPHTSYSYVKDKKTLHKSTYDETNNYSIYRSNTDDLPPLKNKLSLDMKSKGNGSRTERMKEISIYSRQYSTDNDVIDQSNDAKTESCHSMSHQTTWQPIVNITHNRIVQIIPSSINFSDTIFDPVKKERQSLLREQVNHRMMTLLSNEDEDLFNPDTTSATTSANRREANNKRMLPTVHKCRMVRKMKSVSIGEEQQTSDNKLKHKYSVGEWNKQKVFNLRCNKLYSCRETPNCKSTCKLTTHTSKRNQTPSTKVSVLKLNTRETSNRTFSVRSKAYKFQSNNIHKDTDEDIPAVVHVTSDDRSFNKDDKERPKSDYTKDCSCERIDKPNSGQKHAILTAVTLDDDENMREGSSEECLERPDMEKESNKIHKDSCIVKTGYKYDKRINRRSDGSLLTDSKCSTPSLREPQDIDFSRSPSSASSSFIGDEITSLPGSPFYRHVLQRRSSSIDSGISRPGSDFLDVPLLLVQARDRSPIQDESLVESPVVSPVCPVIEDIHGGDLQQQVVHRLSDTVQLPPVTPCHSPDGAVTTENTFKYISLDVPVTAPQVSLTTEDGDDFAVWFGRRGSIFIEEKGPPRHNSLLLQTTRNEQGQVSLAVPKQTDA